MAGGHYVENHTMTHTNLGPTDLNDPTTPAHGFNAAGLPEDPTAEVRDTNALIASYTGGVAPATYQAESWTLRPIVFSPPDLAMA